MLFRRLNLFLLITIVLLGVAVTAAIDLTKLPAPEKRKIDFIKDVQPIFAAHCISCHGGDKQKSDYRLDRKASAFKGGSIGGAIVPGNSATSLLIHYVAGLDEDVIMPPKGKRLSAEQISILRGWIDQGADWPDSADAKDATPPLWSLLPLKKPPVPEVKHKTWARTPVDAFILASLESRGLTPSAPADKRTLIRRVSFDLTGLPPTPQEIEAFLADESPHAYAKLVDSLLASPRYGERWARHWLDAVHFAETHGHDEDAPRPNAWPYRDYVINAFNDDKPYSRFVQEQIAGDALFPDDPQGVAAIGMLAAGPWDQSSQMGIQDGTTDKKIAQYLDRDDMIATTIGTFSSVTIHCARCHYHKFDPISQEDYYALQAVFAGVDRVERSFDADPAVYVKRQALLREKAKLSEGGTARELLLSEQSQRAVAEWEQTTAQKAVRWTVLEPVAAVSAQGAKLDIQKDGSVLSTGTRPEKDTVTITAPASIKRITGVRLEVMLDDSLPHKGPGRQDNGNLHLSEFKVLVRRAANDEAKPVALRNPVADFDQQGWTIAHALDGKVETAWGIFPQVGKAHEAVFELTEPVVSEIGVTLTFVLEQLHGGGHLIGRARLSITDSPSPHNRPPLPAEIADLLSTPAIQRSEDQRAALALYVLKQQNEKALAALPAPRKVYAVASDFAASGNFKPSKSPRAVHLLRRGDILQPIEAAAPGALSCVKGLESRFKLEEADGEGARRAALARWITDKQNVLTWRSIVNRIWQHHFDRGLVNTPNDFGRMGDKPTHPQLLDWLAVTFRDDMHGSFKKLHKLIVTSSVYMQASQHHEPRAALDGDNHLLWRMNRPRLDAEQVRDAIVMLTGKLDLTMGGPSVKQFIETKGVHVTPNVDYTGFDPDHANQYRRSIYRFVFRTVPDPLMDALDCPDLS
ncbi:MAG: PSD1 and planctomycete cytochrome C domain-containing protein, partial [Phycisphaeraceae bacterium]